MLLQRALVTLSKCLTDNGALKPGQFSSAIKATLNEAEVDRERPDYHYLQVLADMLGRRREPVALIDRVAITSFP
jgi:hypothetical protein